MRQGSDEHPGPYFRAREHEAEYAGPGREAPPPEDVAEVKIGWFGPDDPAHPLAGRMWQAALMAVEEANAGGGYQGRPFRLRPAWSESPWGSGIRDLTRLVYEEGIWAVVGAPDGPSAHLVEQVVAKARLPFISPVSTDKSVNLVNVPWMFSLAPSDDAQADSLAEAIADGLVLVSATDHDSRVFTEELMRALRRHGVFPGQRLEMTPGAEDFAESLKELGESHAAAVALIAGPQDAARFLVAMRQAGILAPIFGGPTMGHHAFVEAAGEYADGATFPLLWYPSDDVLRARDFAARFQTRFGIEPDYTAAYTYDAVNLLIAAIRLAGLNRPLIRDAVRDLSPWTGVTGRITWDPTGQNQRLVRLGIIHESRPTPLPSRRTNRPS